jgi:hypothetical protein
MATNEGHEAAMEPIDIDDKLGGSHPVVNGNPS